MNSDKNSFKKRFLLFPGAVPILISAFFVISFGATTIVVYNGRFIQDVIDSASSGDTIIVHDGTYTENINITKQLNVQSEKCFASTSVSSSQKNHTIDISASNFPLKAICLVNRGSKYLEHLNAL